MLILWDARTCAFGAKNCSHFRSVLLAVLSDHKIIAYRCREQRVIRSLNITACVGAFVCCLSKHFSAIHSVVIVCTEEVRLLFKLLLKFRNVLKNTESRSSLTCNQNI